MRLIEGKARQKVHEGAATAERARRKIKWGAPGHKNESNGRPAPPKCSDLPHSRTPPKFDNPRKKKEKKKCSQEFDCARVSQRRRPYCLNISNAFWLKDTVSHHRTSNRLQRKIAGRTYRSQIFQRLLTDPIFFESGLTVLNHIGHDQAIHVAL